jgi:hypothetical protein
VSTPAALKSVTRERRKVTDDDLRNNRSREALMDTVIDLGPELVIDRSRIRDPYLRLWLAAVGEPLAAGSPWVAVSKGAFPAAFTRSTRWRRK